MLCEDCYCVEIDVEVNVNETTPINLTYTQTLFDECIKPLQCMSCGYQFQIGDMIHEIPVDNNYDLYCNQCAKYTGVLDD